MLHGTFTNVPRTSDARPYSYSCVVNRRGWRLLLPRDKVISNRGGFWLFLPPSEEGGGLRSKTEGETYSIAPQAPISCINDAIRYAIAYTLRVITFRLRRITV